MSSDGRILRFDGPGFGRNSVQGVAGVRPMDSTEEVVEARVFEPGRETLPMNLHVDPDELFRMFETGLRGQGCNDNFAGDYKEEAINEAIKFLNTPKPDFAHKDFDAVHYKRMALSIVRRLKDLFENQELQELNIGQAILVNQNLQEAITRL